MHQLSADIILEVCVCVKTQKALNSDLQMQSRSSVDHR